MGLESKQQRYSINEQTYKISHTQCEKIREVYRIYEDVTYEILANRLNVTRGTIGRHIRNECDHTIDFSTDDTVTVNVEVAIDADAKHKFEQPENEKILPATEHLLDPSDLRKLRDGIKLFYHKKVTENNSYIDHVNVKLVEKGSCRIDVTRL